MPISARLNPGVAGLAAMLLLAGTTVLGASATVYVDDNFAGLTTGDDPPARGHSIGTASAWHRRRPTRRIESSLA